MKVKAAKNGDRLAEINIIPLVDVVLVLLIIFMVTAPMLKEGIDIDFENDLREIWHRANTEIDATTGKLLWRHEKLGYPTINDYDVTDGHVIVGYSSGSLGIHNRETGDPENLFPMDHGSVNIVTASGTGKVYVADKREIALYAPRK